MQIGFLARSEPPEKILGGLLTFLFLQLSF